MNILKQQVKNVLRQILTQAQKRKLIALKNFSHKFSLIKLITEVRLYYDKHPGTYSSALIYNKIFNSARISYKYNYFYTYDPTKVRLLPKTTSNLASITPDYEKIICSNINEIQFSVANIANKEFKLYMNSIIATIKNKAERLKKQKNKKGRISDLAMLLPDLLTRDCNSLDEAIQKLLFYNGLLWQSGHRHNGLGRLDYILYKYYLKDLNRGVEDYESAKEKLRNMCLVLGSQTKFKSPSIIGDTGQYILLGGIDKNGKNVENALTEMFLEIFTELKIPDPKLIIRVNDKTSNKIWDLCIKCVSNGCGSPLFMNETLIMNNMIQFGYAKEDVWNLGTSACWEPLIIGKSACQNNPFMSISICNALEKALLSAKTYNSFNELINEINIGLKEEIDQTIQDREFDYSPIMSLFCDSCIEREKDFSHGGSIYMFQGAQILGFPNLINSLLNIKEFVFEKRLVSLKDCQDIILNNYIGHEDLRLLFSNACEKKFGSTNEEVISLCNTIINNISKIINNKYSNGNHVKFGLSSPSYIAQSHDTHATLDGRKANMPYAVHISPISSSIDINEVLNFASMLNYPTNCLNGNVVDFILPSAYQKQRSKLISIIQNAFSRGLFQLQLNVLDKKTLIEAKEHPEKYPHLVVRIWGFSAYFNDLPEEYKDNLIARAETYEIA